MNVRKIKVPTDTPAEFELGNTAAIIQRREEPEQRERGRRWHRDKRGRKAGRWKLQSTEEAVAEKNSKS